MIFIDIVKFNGVKRGIFDGLLSCLNIIGGLEIEGKLLGDLHGLTWRLTWTYLETYRDLLGDLPGLTWRLTGTYLETYQDLLSILNIK